MTSSDRNAGRRLSRWALFGAALAATSALVAGVLVLSPSAEAIPSDPIRPASQLWTALSGTVFDQTTGENVGIQSRLHVVWQSAGDGGGTLHVNVADGTATGVGSAHRYSFTGADNVAIPGNPVVPINVQLRLGQGAPIFPGDPSVPSDPVRVDVAVQLTFSESGALTGASAHFTSSNF